MTEWTPDPERHRPEGMEMAGRVTGVRPGIVCDKSLVVGSIQWGVNPGREMEAVAALNRLYVLAARLERAEEALRGVMHYPFDVMSSDEQDVTRIKEIARAYFDAPAGEETGIRLSMGEDPSEIVPSDGLCKPETP